jgi:hypothetical protein
VFNSDPSNPSWSDSRPNPGISWGASNRRWRFGPRTRLVILAWGIAVGSLECGLATSDLPVGATIAVTAGLALFGAVSPLLVRSRRRIGGVERIVSPSRVAAVCGSVVLALVLSLAGRAVGQALNPGLGIPGEPGYVTFTGPDGKPMAVGDPWGTPCEPIVLAVSMGIPNGVVSQINEVAQEARAAGVDVTIQNRQTEWVPGDLYPPGLTTGDVQFVPIYTTEVVPPELSDGRSEHIAIGWDASPSADRSHEVITDLQGTLYLQALSNAPALVRKSIRQLIAFSQGVDSIGPAGSGIAQGSNVDSFSARDIAAMQRMSGCHYEPEG